MKIPFLPNESQRIADSLRGVKYICVGTFGSEFNFVVL